VLVVEDDVSVRATEVSRNARLSVVTAETADEGWSCASTGPWLPLSISACAPGPGRGSAAPAEVPVIIFPACRRSRSSRADAPDAADRETVLLAPLVKRSSDA
jgi:hypothetical protein